MIVIKLGGSLLQSQALPDCLRHVWQHYQNQPVVLVPGGGEFAGQVRLAQQSWRFDDRTAHCMALLAMQQMALLMRAMQPGFVIAASVAGLRAAAAQGKTGIWSPDVRELDQADVPSTWDITSDSLAAWLANQLPAKELVLVKAASIAEGASLMQLAAQDIVDKAFCQFIGNPAYLVRVVGQAGFFKLKGIEA